MALSDFLSNGQPPKDSTFTSTTSQTVLPDWYTNYAMQILANQNAVSAQPYTAYQGPRVADFTQAQQQGFGMTGQAATAYQPGLSQAQQTTTAAGAAPGGLATAQPYLQQAGQTGVANIGEYMNPYTDAVVDRIGQLGQRNLTENLLPQVEGRYIAAGQLGFGGREGAQGTPSGMMTDTARALRDTQEATLAAQSQALQSGYGQALGASQTDLSRMAGLAGTAGGFATDDIGQQLQVGQQQANLGALSQQLGLTGANAVTGVGAQQQALNQQNLNVAYQDFLKQQGYPQEQINAMLNTMQGVQGAVPTATTEEGLVPLGYSKPGTTAKIIGGLSAAAGIGSAIAGM
jgi:hypothetical protein